MPQMCLYAWHLKEDKLQDGGKAEGSEGFNRLSVYGKKQEPYGSIRGLLSCKQNSHEEATSLELCPEFLGPETQ